MYPKLWWSRGKSVAEAALHCTDSQSVNMSVASAQLFRPVEVQTKEYNIYQFTRLTHFDSDFDQVMQHTCTLARMTKTREIQVVSSLESKHSFFETPHGFFIDPWYRCAPKW